MLHDGKWVRLVSIWAVLALASTALPLAAQIPPDFRDWYSFRHSSALPGMLFAVTPQGEMDFGGAFQQNIPVAYTPTLGQWVAGGNSGSDDHNLRFGDSLGEVNGTLFAGVGLGQSPRGIYVSWMATGHTWEGAWNLQVQVSGPTDASSHEPAVAVGVQDLFNERNGPIKEGHSARSFYVVATGSLPQATWRPVYWTLGLGDGRFKNGMAGVSVPLDDHFKLAGEWDSFNLNAGLAWSLQGAGNQDPYDVMLYLGETDLQYPIIGATWTWR